MIQTNMPEYYYCYSPNLFKFLTMENGIRYICCGLNQNTKRKFWQYKATPELNEAIRKYRSMKEVKMLKNQLISIVEDGYEYSNYLHV